MDQLREEPDNSDVVQQILLYARTSPISVFGYGCVYTVVKKPKAWGQPAGVRQKSTVEAPQRLNAENLTLAYLVGLFEGDGWLTVTKKGIYFQCEVGIELHARDTQLIYKIKKLLTVGVVAFRERDGSKKVQLRVRNKAHLKNIILPIFDRYPLLSNKQYDYLRFKTVLLSNLVRHKDLAPYTRPTQPLNSVESILSAPYFAAWLVGFIESEGCFSVYKQWPDRDDMSCSFEISQTNGYILLSAISKYLSFSTTTALQYTDKTNNSKAKVSGVRSIENVIKFMDKAPVKLLGHKRLQYKL